MEIFLQITRILSTIIFIFSCTTYYIYGNYLKIYRPEREIGSFKFVYYGMGRKIYLCWQDYLVLLGVLLGTVSSVIVLCYLHKRRRD